MLPSQPAGKSKELCALTGARFFAAAFVVFYHFARPLPAGIPAPLVAIANTGYAAVGFFFLLSGFVMAYSYMRPDGLMRGSAKSFWSARIARIYPAYLLAFLIATPFNIAGSVHLNGAAAALPKLLTGGVSVLALVQAWTPWTAWYWNYPAWSLSVEAFFYLVFPLLLPVVGRLPRRACFRLLPVVWLSAIIIPIAFCAVHPSSPEAPFSKSQLALEVTPLLRLPEFVMGMLLGRIYVSKPVIARSAWLTYTGIAGAALLLSLSGIIPRPLLANGLVSPFSALVILGLAGGRGLLAKFLSLRPLILLGEASYGIYILQAPVATLFGVEVIPANPLRVALFAVGLVALSTGFFVFVEQPLRPRLKSALLTFLERPEPAAIRTAMAGGNA
jgi:peptidoglycan/LPS O-acetylase OafA/YrhL